MSDESGEGLRGLGGNLGTAIAETTEATRRTALTRNLSGIAARVKRKMNPETQVFSLDNYLTEPISQDKTGYLMKLVGEECKKRVNLIDEICEKAQLPTELSLANILRQRRQEIIACAEETIREIAVGSIYKRLDPSFLDTFNRLKHATYNISVPRFGVYPVFGENLLEIETSPNSSRVLIRPKLPANLERYLIRATSTRYKIAKPYATNNDVRIFLSSYLNLVVPEETKCKIDSAIKIFSDNLFFIAEIEPEGWAIREFVRPEVKEKITKDPLVVGVLRKSCYLIDKFNTTFNEDWISNEFVIDI